MNIGNALYRRLIRMPAAIAFLMLVACGGGNSGSTPAPATYTVGVIVTGLSGSGLVLQQGGADDLAIAANGAATFSIALTSGAAYAVTVKTQPSSPPQTCGVASGSGSVGPGNVTEIAITCVTEYTIGVGVAGLRGLGLILELNGGDDLAIAAAKTSSTFSSLLTTGANYSITVKTQPSSPSQTCSVAGSSGILAGSNVTNVAVTCIDNVGSTGFSVSVTVSGLTAGSPLVLQLNGGNQLEFTANGVNAFSTELASGTSYLVTIITQPSSPLMETCTISNPSGTIGTANITNVAVTCVTGYTVSVTVSSLAGSGLAVLLNGGSSLSITANGNATFAAELPSGATYAVTVGTQPQLPKQTCTVINGSGTVGSGNIANVVVVCPLINSSTLGNAWTLMSVMPGEIGIYGTQGSSSAANYPGIRYLASSWCDSSGNLWMFGGNGFSSAFQLDAGYLNDLWKYVPGAGTWTWVSGSNSSNASSVYGSQGVAAPTNVPGARNGAAKWIDSAGNLWMFGGAGIAAYASSGKLNDLWEYTPSNGSWTWISGSNITGAAGVYGAQGTPSVNNVPGARTNAASSIDSAGNLWLFGGETDDANGNYYPLNDLWVYNPTAKTWTWVTGSVAFTSGTKGATGVYGTRGSASTVNTPGARELSNAWADPGGNLWLFGGYGNDSTGSPFYLNDLWKFSPSGGTWTWVGGSNVGNALGIYGTLGAAAPGNVPGARTGAASGTGADGSFWLFGGAGFASTGTSNYLNDLWKYNPSSSTWSWISGSNAGGTVNVDGTPGVPSKGNSPGGRYMPASWLDPSGSFWLFGGQYGQNMGIDFLHDDLWVYTP